MTEIDETLIFDDDELALLRDDFVSDPAYSRAMRHIVFVYGTMRTGQRNHDRLHVPGVTFLGKAQTFDGEFDIRIKRCRCGHKAPVAIPGAMYIRGEVYEVPGSVLRDLDLCEGHPDVYKRTAIQIGGLRDAWIYLYMDDDYLHGMITDKAKMRQHGIHYHSSFNAVEYFECPTDTNCSTCTKETSN